MHHAFLKLMPHSTAIEKKMLASAQRRIKSSPKRQQVATSEVAGRVSKMCYALLLDCSGIQPCRGNAMAQAAILMQECVLLC